MQRVRPGPGTGWLHRGQSGRAGSTTRYLGRTTRRPLRSHLDSWRLSQGALPDRGFLFSAGNPAVAAQIVAASGPPSEGNAKQGAPRSYGAIEPVVWVVRFPPVSHPTWPTEYLPRWGW